MRRGKFLISLFLIVFLVWFLAFFFFLKTPLSLIFCRFLPDSVAEKVALYNIQGTCNLFCFLDYSRQITLSFFALEKPVDEIAELKSLLSAEQFPETKGFALNFFYQRTKNNKFSSLNEQAVKILTDFILRKEEGQELRLKAMDVLSLAGDPTSFTDMTSELLSRPSTPSLVKIASIKFLLDGSAGSFDEIFYLLNSEDTIAADYAGQILATYYPRQTWKNISQILAVLTDRNVSEEQKVRMLVLLDGLKKIIPSNESKINKVLKSLALDESEIIREVALEVLSSLQDKNVQSSI